MAESRVVTMVTSSTNERLPVICSRCNRQGYIEIENVEESHWTRCLCGQAIASVWCPKCEMGGDFVSRIEKQPSDWTCPDCKTQYQLPLTYYKTPLEFHVSEIVSDVEPEQTIAEQAKSIVKNMSTLGLIFIAVFVAIALCFAVIVYLRNWL
jgi:UDP-N-acetylmuramyl tripeptide synthase